MKEKSVYTFRRELGAQIRTLRIERGYSLRSFALMIGVDHAYLSRSERGEKSVNLNFLLRVAQGLDVELYELFQPIKTKGTIIDVQVDEGPAPHRIDIQYEEIPATRKS